MAVAQFFDFGTFVVMVHRHGVLAEANPLVAGLFEGAGIPAIAVAKLALVALVCGVTVALTAIRPFAAGHRRLAQVVAGLAIAAGLIGGTTNALAFGAL
jgi:hypothetical protein